MLHSYILNDKNEPIKVPYLEGLNWKLDNFDRCIVRLTQVGLNEVSTVFISESFTDPPSVFETMVFGPNADRGQWRCATWDEAVLQHERVVKQLEEGK